jgi:PAS domain S-box-containing protein
MNDDIVGTKLLELYDRAPCGYIITQPDGVIVRVNQTLLTWLEETYDELVSVRRIQDLLSVPGKLFYENQYDPLLRMQGFVNEVAFDLVSKDGQPIPVLISSVLERDEDSQALFVVSSVFKATQRRLYEQELLAERRRADQIAAIVRHSSDAIISAAADGRIESWNAAAERIFGYFAREAIGRGLNELFMPMENPDDLLATLRAGEAVTINSKVRRADHRTTDVSASLTPHMGPLGELASISLIVRDETQRRALERLQHEFLAMAGHELKNPVVAITIHAQLMQRLGTYDDAGMSSIVAQADQLRTLIDKLLSASQIEADRLDLRMTRTDLEREVRTAANLMLPVRPTIAVESSAERIIVEVDRAGVGQVLANLLTNAVKYSADGSPITLRLNREDQYARLDVIDQGVGIPPDALPHVFDRFYRAEGAAGRAQGLGLGLFISQRLVLAHGGSIRVQSEWGRGTTFTVLLPLARDDTLHEGRRGSVGAESRFEHRQTHDDLLTRVGSTQEL